MKILQPSFLIGLSAFALAFSAFFLGMVCEGFRRTGDGSILWHSAPVALMAVLTSFFGLVAYAHKLLDHP